MRLADRIRVLVNGLRGRETVLEVQLLGRPFRLGVRARRELKRVREVSREGALIGRILDHLEPGDVVYDVGANIGLVSLLVAGSHPETLRVHGFEPEPENARDFSRNVELNGLEGRIQVHALALGHRLGEVELFVRGGPGEGRHSTVESKGATGSIRVPVETAAAFAQRSGEAPHVMKVDVEGAEGRVLAGAETLLEGGRLRELFLEIHPQGEGDRMPGGESIDAWLGARGYHMVWEQVGRSRSHRHYRQA